ncbi:uncharacterized protein BDZ99DRAFT_479490 [Mytilinidion resinicola]|uniref:Transcription factor Iwr1 domain-containing protein n=1 Tax=Mytilinidion resinicola TaxID=574789 RepID=A0A6A6YDY8_9PEZI|nr:uncharacterized protein BDZ99DRAFT_479490 [Mytilinidion resinicola]KAF2806214.1 hypothetical protein BDZ99DRAFT_479490 [Mytilinidion resinicola]
MSEPSVNTLRIKRKRDEQGPHALVVDQPGAKKHQTYHGAVFRRIDPNDASFGRAQAPQRTASAYVLPTIPIVRTTQPGEENRPTRARLDSTTPAQSPHTSTTQPQSPSHSSLLHQLPADTSTFRRFHLSRRSLPASHASPSGVDKKRKRENAVPVFVERKKKTQTSTQGEASKAGSQQEHGGTEESKSKDKASAVRKRPGAGAVELQWRARNWSTLESKKSFDTLKQPPKDVVKDLEKFAEEIDHQESKTASSPPRATPTKRGPKAPALRYKDRYPEESKTQDHDAIDVDMEDEGDYVYDTYVRDVDMTKPLDEGGILGLIVISDEDQELWDTFEDNEESDEFDTDDEDENAEDYYGADYPEDEVDSDDEMGLDPYKYRHGASDDEEYDAEDAAWSNDEEADPEKPWMNKLQLK